MGDISMSDSYLQSIKSSEKTTWVLDEVLPPTYNLDLTKQFIPMPIKAENKEHGNLSKQELCLLSQLNASCYTYFIEIVERYIVDLVMGQFPLKQTEEKNRIRAMSRFLDEEVKHQQLFERFNQVLEKNLNQHLIVPNNGEIFARKVMAKSPLSIWLLTLHTEVMTHFHYTFLFKSGVDLEPKFIEILKAHWMEESQHVKIDLLEVNELVKSSSEAELHQAIKDYAELMQLVDEELTAANVAVVQNLKSISGIQLSQQQEMNLMDNLIQSSRNLTIHAGLRHATFINAVKSFNLGLELKLPEISKMFEAPVRIFKAA